MPIYKNWNDFDGMRDGSKVLVIYGAGVDGRKLLNICKIIPDYFCDRNAKKIKKVEYRENGISFDFVKCLTLKELLIELKGRDADILVSNSREKDITDLHRIFDKKKFTENTLVYFRYLYDTENRKFTKEREALVCEINGKYMNDSCSYASFYNLYEKMISMLKNAYFDNDVLQLYEEINQYFSVHAYKHLSINNGSIRYEYTYKDDNDNLCNFTEKQEIAIEKQIVYFFSDSRFLGVWNKREYRLNFMLAMLLNKSQEVNYEIQNYSVPGSLLEAAVRFQLTNQPLIRNSIVIISCIKNPYLLSLVKQYCKKYNCRLIYYSIPDILSRKFLSDFESFFIEKNRFLLSLNDGTASKEFKTILNVMDIEFYEPPNSFFYSDKTIYIDRSHLGDYGNEIIAKHLHDIITNKIKPDSSCKDFYIESREKIEYAKSAVSLVVPDIKIHLKALEKYKQNYKNCGAIVMNCNPFTLGHRHLIEYAAGMVEHLYIFVVEEDKSEFSFSCRYKLVKKNMADVKNVTVLPSGKFIISSTTFDSYFGKSGVSEERAASQDVSFDLLIFASVIAPALSISKRFVGQEPFDPLTRHYNEEMKKLLPEYGCEVVEIQRLEKSGSAVSASLVRKLLKEKNFEEIKKIVPKATYRYLLKIYKQAKAARIHNALKV